MGGPKKQMFASSRKIYGTPKKKAGRPRFGKKKNQKKRVSKSLDRYPAPGRPEAPQNLVRKKRIPVGKKHLHGQPP